GIQVNAGEVHLVVERQHVISRADHPIRSGTALQLTAGVGAEGVGYDGVGAVDHRAVEVGGDVVDLLARVARPGAGAGVELRAVEVDYLAADAVGVEVRVARWHGNVGGLELGAFAAGRQVDVVVDEL